MPTPEFLNVLEPQYSRYLHLRDEIEAYLTEKYGAEIDFRVFHENDRWCFYTPEKLTKKQTKEMTREIVNKSSRKQADDEAGEGGGGDGNDTIVEPASL